MRRARGICSTPRCPNLVDAHGKCSTHLQAQRVAFDRTRPSSSERGYDAEWRKLRAAILRIQPWCSSPCCSEPSREVHHQPRYVPGTDHRDYRLTPYCSACHGALTSAQVR